MTISGSGSPSVEPLLPEGPQLDAIRRRGHIRAFRRRAGEALVGVIVALAVAAPLWGLRGVGTTHGISPAAHRSMSALEEELLG